MQTTPATRQGLPWAIKGESGPSNFANEFTVAIVDARGLEVAVMLGKTAEECLENARLVTAAVNLANQ